MCRQPLNSFVTKGTSVFLVLLALDIAALMGATVWLTVSAATPRALAPNTTGPPTASFMPPESATPTPVPTQTQAPTATVTFTRTHTDTATLTPAPTDTASPVPSSTPSPTPTLYAPDLPTAPANLDNAWQTLPVIPVIDAGLQAHLRAIYARGQALGNSPQAFSKVGDCNTESEFFLVPFDTPTAYHLGDYTDLQALINNFQGSFARVSLAAHTGFGPSAMFDPMWADPAKCGTSDGPLPCEYRLQRPSLALIGLGTHNSPESKFEGQLRLVIEYSLEHGVIPILATKVDAEGGNRVNALIARLADQYQVPLWNFWRAGPPLWNHGQPDGIHFTWATNDFSSAQSLRNGWPVRNLTALQALDAVWKAATAP